MDKLLELMAEIDIPSAYDHFAEGESPDPPFITYLLPGSDNFAADGKVYFRITEVHIETKRTRRWRRSSKPCLMRTVFFMTKRRSGLTPRNCMRFFIHSKRRIKTWVIKSNTI